MTVKIIPSSPEKLECSKTGVSIMDESRKLERNRNNRETGKPILLTILVYSRKK